MASATISTSFSEATKHRHSVYALQAKSSVPDGTVVKLVEQALAEVPAAFGRQTTRITILFGDEHRKLWDIVGRTLLNKIGQERWDGGTKARIAGFTNAYASILFWDDQTAAKAMEQNAPDIYKDKSEEWVHQSSGMFQYYIWTALSTLGLGANLQHYNPIIDDEVKRTWNINPDWKLRAQLVYGTPAEDFVYKPKPMPISVEDRLQVHGASS